MKLNVQNKDQGVTTGKKIIMYQSVVILFLFLRLSLYAQPNTK